MRFPALDEATYDDDQRRMAEKAARGGPFDAFIRAPLLWEALQQVRACLAAGVLSPAAREAAILAIARHWRAPAAYAGHVALAERAGLAPDAILAIGSGAIPHDLPEDAALALAVVQELAGHGSLSDRLYQAAIALLGERGLIELVGLIGFFTTIGLTLNVAGRSAPAPFGANRPE
jgi:4-carboxymuconolactone decarboxylase